MRTATLPRSSEPADGVGHRPTGHIFIFVGVSGAGKSTICGLLANEGVGELSISHTTRPRSAQEEDGVHYYFVSRAKFKNLIATGAMVEHAEVHGQLYGTGRAWLDAACARGTAALLDIDIAGALQIRAQYGDRSSVVFLLPPDLDALERRLRARKRESEDEIRRRLSHGLDEILQLQKADYMLVNDDLEKTHAAARGIVTGAPEAEELRIARQEETAERWMQAAIDKIKLLRIKPNRSTKGTIDSPSILSLTKTFSLLEESTPHTRKLAIETSAISAEVKSMLAKHGVNGVKTGADVIDALTKACHKTHNNTANKDERALCAGFLYTHFHCRAGDIGACFNFKVVNDRAQEKGEKGDWARSTNEMLAKLDE